MKARVHVAGLGCISAIGNSVTETYRALEQEQSGIGTITLFDTIYKEELPVGEVKLSNEELQSRACAKKKISRTSLLGLIAAREALHDSRIRNTKKWRTGFISATTVGGMDRTEHFAIDFLKDIIKGDLHDVVYHECGSTTEWIADQLKIIDFLSTINTACSSSVNAIQFGARLIAQDYLDVVIAGGTDALTKFTLNGFNSLMILDKKPCRPFDASRQGLNLGEGAGYVVLVSDRVLREEQLQSRALVSGFGNTNDAFHQTASSPEGRGSFMAMSSALDMAGLKPSEIDYINLHGTGTQNNDSSEGIAIQRLFDPVPRTSSTKAYTGHTLGASGGIEAVFAVLSLMHGCIYPNLRFENRIPELNYSPQQKFERGLPVHHVLSNSFGFGGNCSSIIFSKT